MIQDFVWSSAIDLYNGKIKEELCISRVDFFHVFFLGSADKIYLLHGTWRLVTWGTKKACIIPKVLMASNQLR